MSDTTIEGSTPGASPTPAEPRHLRRAIIAWIVVSCDRDRGLVACVTLHRPCGCKRFEHFPGPHI